jgi:glutathione S-transferase
MITLHHLRIGRSIFTVWLLEELELEYTLKEYLRNPETMRAPPELKQAHPLGKSPVIEDDGVVISESGASTSYLLEQRNPEDRFLPQAGRAARAEYLQWLHYPEGSVFTPLLMKMLSLRIGGLPPMDAFSEPEIKLHFDYIDSKLGDRPFILGDAMTGADFGITYVTSMAQRLGQLDPWPRLQAYLERNLARPAFARAVERAVE